MADRQIVIVGGGGHAKVLVEALRSQGCEPHGVIARTPAHPLGVSYLGDDRTFCLPPTDYALVNGVGSIRPGPLRREIFDRFRGTGYCFVIVRHASAVLACDAIIGEGVQLMAGCIVQPGVTIGANTIVNTRAAIDHDCVIGVDVHIAPGAVLSGGVSVGDGTHVGTGAVVVQGVAIGRQCLVAAGAVVVRDVPDGATVRGVPATIA